MKTGTEGVPEPHGGSLQTRLHKTKAVEKPKTLGGQKNANLNRATPVPGPNPGSEVGGRKRTDEKQNLPSGALGGESVTDVRGENGWGGEKKQSSKKKPPQQKVS